MAQLPRCTRTSSSPRLVRPRLHPGRNKIDLRDAVADPFDVVTLIGLVLIDTMAYQILLCIAAVAHETSAGFPAIRNISSQDEKWTVSSGGSGTEPKWHSNHSARHSKEPSTQSSASAGGERPLVLLHETFDGDMFVNHKVSAPSFLGLGQPTGTYRTAIRLYAYAIYATFSKCAIG